MAILGVLLLVATAATIVIAFVKTQKEKTESLYVNGISIKALRLTELQDVVSDPAHSEKVRDAAREELHYRVRNNLI